MKLPLHEFLFVKATAPFLNTKRIIYIVFDFCYFALHLFSSVYAPGLNQKYTKI